MDIRKTIPVLLILLASVTIMLPCMAHADENLAMSLLKKMSDYIGSRQAVELSFESSIEIITPQLEKIQFTNSGEAFLRRPNKLRLHRRAGHADVKMFYNGKTVSIYGKHTNSYAQFEVSGDIDNLIHGMREGHGVALPGSDLLLQDSYQVLAADVMEAKYIGRAIINARECEHLAFRNFDTDWQLWVQTGQEPIPCKMVVTTKTMNNAPQYSVYVKSWKTGMTSTDNDFVFVPPANAKKVSEDQLIEFDELPPDASSGGNQ